MTDLAVTLVACLLLIIGIHADENTPHWTRRKVRRMRRQRLKLNPRLR